MQKILETVANMHLSCSAKEAMELSVIEQDPDYTLDQLCTILDYRHTLEDGFNEFLLIYRTQHKRSKRHNIESIGDYYFRWKKYFQEEIARVDKILYDLMKSND